MQIVYDLVLFECSAPGRNDEDELYETYISETNAIYQLVEGELLLSDEYSGRPLKHGMLRSKEASLRR